MSCGELQTSAMRVVAYLMEPISNAGSRCRIAALAPGLAEAGIDLRVCPPMGDQRAARLKAGGRFSRILYYLIYLLGRLRDIPKAARADAVVVFRGMFPIGPPWMEWLVRRLNRNLILDFDDAIWLRPPFATGGYRFVDLRAARKVLRRSRAAVVGSPWLTEFALRHCPRVEVIPSCMDMGRYRMRPDEPGSPLVIGWIGARSGFIYLEQLADVWRALHQRHGAILRVVSNGEFACEGVPVDNVHWSLESEVEAVRSFDIGVMPLLDTPFERCKAGFKLIQCMAAGVATVASPVGVNQTICGEDQSRGLIARTPAEWEAQLERLLEDPELRRRLGRAGHDHVHQTYDVGRAVQDWATLLTDLVQRG